jgi:integrase
MVQPRRRADTGAWEIDLGRTATGRRERHSLPAHLSEREARAIARRLKQERLSVRLGLSAPASPTLAVYAADYCAWHALEHPASTYRVQQILEQHIVPRFGHVQLAAIERKDVEAWKHERRSAGAKAHTVAKELRTLKAVLNRAVTEELIARSPINHVSGPRILDAKPHTWFAAAQLQAIYDACVERWHASAWRLLSNTGMRRGEAMHARRDWVRPDALQILSTEDERTKSGKWREVPLSAGARLALEELERATRERTYLLPRVRLPSLSRAAIGCIRRAGLSAGSIHTFRHTYISHLVMAGVPLRTVQIYAGHAHYATTEQYAYLQPARAATAALELAL